MPARHVRGRTMRRRTVIIVAAIRRRCPCRWGRRLLAEPAACDGIAGNCIAALKERLRGDKAKPGACEGLTEDDCSAILMSHVIDNLPRKDRDTLDCFDNGTIDGRVRRRGLQTRGNPGAAA
ncbi:hypothetical protein [Streptomyces sp. NPDC055060]